MEAAILCEAPRSLKPSSFSFLQFASLCTACAALPHLQKTGKHNLFYSTGSKYIAARRQKTML